MISALSNSDSSAVATQQASRAKRPDADQVFKKLDSDSKGYLSESDLVKISPAGAKAADTDAKAEAAFKRMDTDGDGKVTESEFKAAASSASSSAKTESGGRRGGVHGGGGGHRGGAAPAPASTPTQQQYEPADANKDGKVSQQEQSAYDAQQAAKQTTQASGTNNAITTQAAEALKAYETVTQATE